MGIVQNNNAQLYEHNGLTSGSILGIFTRGHNYKLQNLLPVLKLTQILLEHKL